VTPGPSFPKSRVWRGDMIRPQPGSPIKRGGVLTFFGDSRGDEQTGKVAGYPEARYNGRRGWFIARYSLYFRYLELSISSSAALMANWPERSPSMRACLYAFWRGGTARSSPISPRAQAM
jgi:hypothetical protein